MIVSALTYFESGVASFATLSPDFLISVIFAKTVLKEFLIEIYSMINGFNNYKKEELANGVFKETNELLPKTYRRKIY